MDLDAITALRARVQHGLLGRPQQIIGIGHPILPRRNSRAEGDPEIRQDGGQFGLKALRGNETTECVAVDQDSADPVGLQPSDHIHLTTDLVDPLAHPQLPFGCGRGQPRQLVLGETVLVHAVGSGVGTAALQLARVAGARVIGTSRTDEKLTRAGELGLDRGVHVTDGTWPESVLDFTGGRGADVILDLVGAPYLAGNQTALAHGGRMIVVGVSGGWKAETDLRALMTKRASIVGTVLRARPIEEKIALARAFATQVVPLLAEGRVRPVVDAFYGPERIAEAHERLEASDTFGKLVLSWD